jgi:signal transduction histidine kinase
MRDIPSSRPLLCLGVLLAILAAPGAPGASPKRVLLLHSCGRDFASFDSFSETSRSALAQQTHGDVVYYDLELESARVDGGRPERPLVSCLLKLFNGHRPALVVPIGGPATRFARKFRPQLFPTTPMLIAATDQRHVQSASLATDDIMVAVANDHVRMIDSILKLLRATTNIGVIIIIASLVATRASALVFYRHAARVRKLKSGHEVFTRELLLSQENERKRIASELHDSLGQDLLLIKNRLSLLAADVKQLPAVLTQLKELSVAASRAIADIRSISQALRPAALEQVGLTKAIEWMIEQLGETSPIRFSGEIDNIDGLLPPDSEMNFYRIIQEALNNVIKHAQATEVLVSVKRDQFGIALSVHDNGRGLNSKILQDAQSRRQKKPTLGLVSMAERAKLLAAEIQIQSAEGKGTRLTLALPLPQFQNHRQGEFCADRMEPRDQSSLEETPVRDRPVNSN